MADKLLLIALVSPVGDSVYHVFKYYFTLWKNLFFFSYISGGWVFPITKMKLKTCTIFLL